MIAPSDKADINAVVVCRMYYINILKQKLRCAKTYEQILLDQRSVVDRHRCHMAAEFLCVC